MSEEQDGLSREEQERRARAGKVTQLRNLSVHEVSLVDRPANPGAVVLLVKRDVPALSESQRATLAGIEASIADMRSQIAKLEKELMVPYHLQPTMKSSPDPDARIRTRGAATATAGAAAHGNRGGPSATDRKLPFDQSLVGLARRIVAGESWDSGWLPPGAANVLYAELERVGQETRVRNELDAQAFTRASMSPDGRIILGAHTRLARPVAKVATAAQVEKGGSPVEICKARGYTLIEIAARELQRRDPTLSDASAFAKAMKDPANGEAAKMALGHAPAEPAPEGRHDMPPPTAGLKELDGMADDLRAEYPDKSHAQRFAMAMQTKEGQAAYRRHVSELGR